MTVYRKHCDRKWLALIKQEQKTFEGRLDRGDWNNMQFGDYLILFDGEMEVKCKIVQKYRVASFDILYKLFGKSLLPTGDTVDIYKTIYTEEELANHTVVGLKLEVLRE